MPIVQAFFAFDFNALINAFFQDIFILAFFAAIALIYWLGTSFRIDDDKLFIKSGVFFTLSRVYNKQSICVIDIKRPLYYRIFGAAKITLYFKNHALPKKISFVMPKKAAFNAAETLMPLKRENSVFEPVGFERFVLVLLSANALTTALFLWYTLQTVSDFTGRDIFEVTQIAGENFLRFEKLLEQFLPAGIAFLTAIVFGIAGFSFLNSFFRSGGLRVCRWGGIIYCAGGILSKTERRIDIKSVSSCDVRITPTSRILKRYAVYVTAGSFKQSDFPVMIIKKGQAHTVQTLFADYSPCTGNISNVKHKSLLQYLYKPVICLVISTLLFLLAYYFIPMSVPTFAVLIILCVGACLQSLEGFFKEGVCTNSNRTLSIHYARFFTLHKVCVFSNAAMYTLFQTPFGVRKKYATFYSGLPSGITFRARGVSPLKAGRIKFVE